MKKKQITQTATICIDYIFVSKNKFRDPGQKTNLEMLDPRFIFSSGPIWDDKEIIYPHFCPFLSIT